MPLWNANQPTVAEVAAAQATADAALAGADASMKIAANGSDVADPMTFRANVGAMPLPTRANVSGQYAVLSGRPYAVNMTTLQVTKDTWRFAPFRIDSLWTVARLAVMTTVAAGGGTAAMIFGLFVADSTGRPAARQADYSSFGSIDLTAVAGPLTLVTAGLTIPAGEWYIGFAWSGTATTPPTMNVLNHSHPSVSSSPLSSTQGGYSYAASGASVPATAVPAAAALTSPAVWVQIV